MEKKILDVTCGSRTIWFNKTHPAAVYCDSIVLCDDEGNLHDEAYREHPYSGLGFMLHHAHEENPGCPIASYECDGGILGGVYIYDTEEQATEAWNKRDENYDEGAFW